MANTRLFEDSGKKARRYTNNSPLFWRSYDNKRDIPVLRLNVNDKPEFSDTPVVEGKGRVALYSELGNGQYFFRDPITLSADNLSSKSFDLTHTPSNPDGVLLLPDGGPLQLHGIDFVITGKTLSWNNLGMSEVELEVGDKFFVFYQT